MSDPAQFIRAQFPGHRSDPYQKAAVDALLKIIFAGENTEAALKDLVTAVSFFIEDPPLSLAFNTPARHAEQLAQKLVALAAELRKGAHTLKDLAAYADQFGNRNAPYEPEQQHVGIRRPSTAATGAQL